MHLPSRNMHHVQRVPELTQPNRLLPFTASTTCYHTLYLSLPLPPPTYSKDPFPFPYLLVTVTVSIKHCYIATCMLYQWTEDPWSYFLTLQVKVTVITSKNDTISITNIILVTCVISNLRLNEYFTVKAGNICVSVLYHFSYSDLFCCPTEKKGTKSTCNVGATSNDFAHGKPQNQWIIQPSGDDLWTTWKVLKQCGTRKEFRMRQPLFYGNHNRKWPILTLFFFFSKITQ